MPLKNRLFLFTFLVLLAALLAIIAVARHFGTLLGREPGVSLLVLLTGLKLLELRTLRDAACCGWNTGTVKWNFEPCPTSLSTQMRPP